MKFGLFVCICAAFNFPLGNGENYTININMDGYIGVVNMAENGPDFDVTVTFTAGKQTDLFDTFAITSFPPIFGRLRNASEVCQNLGPVERTLPGVTEGSRVTVPNLSSDDVFSRGLLITSNIHNTRICAVISPDNEVKTYYAKFIGPIVGDIWIRSRSAPPALFVLSNLAYSDATGEPSATTNFNLTGYTGGNINSDFAIRCQSLMTPTTFASIPIGNSAASSGRRSATFLPGLSTDELNLGLVSPGSGAIASCTKLNEVKRKSVTTELFWDDIRGSISMTQNSPFEATITSVSLTGVTETPAQFHVHDYPVPQRRNEQDQRCSSENVGGHLNPYGIDIDNSPASGTDDQYEIGDLSGKYGLLENETIENNFTDWNLPLYGVNSVVGRSIVIHYPNGSRWVCANIGYPSDVVTAVVKFKYPAYGYMYFRQASDDFDSETTVFGELANLNNTNTLNHNYHVHLYPVGADCASAGPHYDPAGLADSADYSNICSPEDPFQCEIGDVSGRHGGVNIGSSLTKFFVTDPNLPLQGPFSIIERSIVIHDANSAAPRYACANITTAWTTRVTTRYFSWKGDDNNGTVTGHITFSQTTEYDRTTVTSEINGLNNRASGYHIHVLPISTDAVGSDQCSASSVQGHYNPFNVPTILAPTVFTYDKYEVGDLSSKYGLAEDTDRLGLSSIYDNNLPLSSHAVNAAGRSVVIHHPGGERWKCNNIDIQPSDRTGYVIAASTFFTDTSIIGNVHLRQVVYDDGFASVTTILVSLSNSEQPTSNHNWHVHIDPVLQQDQCDVALGHYDPYMTITTTQDYSAQCNRDNPLACEVGDLSNKMGQYSIDGISRLYVDVDVPLHTDKTVLGRSMVFHAENGGASRLVCANIIPVERTYTLAYPSTVEYDYYRFTSAVAEALEISRRRVVVLHNTNVPVNVAGCSKVMVHIAGSVDQNLLDAILSGLASKMNPYGSTANCESETGANVVGMVSDASARITINVMLTVLASAVMALVHML